MTREPEDLQRQMKKRKYEYEKMFRECLKCFVIGTNTVCHYAQVHFHLQTSVSERNSLLSLVGHHYSILIIGILKKIHLFKETTGPLSGS